MSNGYSKGPGAGTGGGGNLRSGREARPGTTAVLHKKKRKKLFSSGGPEGELNRVISRGTATTQRMRYAAGGS